MEEEKLTLTVVTPERAVLDKVECHEVTLPTLKGEIGVLPGHTPLITLVGIGTVSYRVGSRKVSLAVREGFAEIAGDSLRILADRASTREAVDPVAVALEKSAAEERREHVVGNEQLDAVNADVAYAEARLKIAAETPN